MKNKKSLLFIGLIILVSVIYSFQNKTEKNYISESVITILYETDTMKFPISTPMFPTVMVKTSSKDSSQAMGMRDLKIDVKIVGTIATTTFEMTFYNDLDRILEGELYFPLGEGRTVSRFAMDFDGKLREGVMVEKAKGRAVFESIVRKKVDPGLLEWTKGNNFKARVYPIPAKGTKKIVIAYEQDLFHTPTEYIYILPLGFKQIVKNFDVKIEVLKQESKPQMDYNELTNLTFEKWNENYVAKLTKKNYTPNQQIGVSLPIDKKAKNYYTETANNENYFYLSLNPEIHEKAKELPSNLGIIWDISNSSNRRNFKKEFEILKEYLSDFSNLNVEIITFSNTVHEKKQFTLSNGNSDKIIAFLKAQEYDGGTQLGILDLAKYNSQEFLLFSDGLSNFGKSEIKTANKTVHCLTSNVTSDYSYLKHLAGKTGGQFLNINRLKSMDVIVKLNNYSYRFINATYNPNEIEETYPKSQNMSFSGFQLAGKLKTNKATITLNFGFENTVFRTETYTISLDENKYEGMIRKIWAQKKLNYLDVNHEKYNQEITDLGKEYGLVTRNTSLIILDNVQDYIEHKIVPPAEWQKEYYEKVSKIEKDKKEEEQKQLAKVQKLLKNRTDWWNTTFDYTPPPPPKKKIIVDTIVDAGNDSTIALNGNSRIEGVVRDSSTKETLPFVNVVLIHNGSQIGGASTDFDGKFIINSVPVGTHSLQISYVGFNKIQINGIHSISNRTSAVNINLKASNVTLESFEVVDYSAHLLGTNYDNTDVNSVWNSNTNFASNNVGADLGGVVIEEGRNSTVRTERIRTFARPNIGSTSTDLMLGNFGVVSSNELIGNSNTFYACTSAGKKKELEKLNASKIKLKEWSPNAKYIQELKKKSKTELWAAYLELKKKYGNSPSFFMDVSQYFSTHLDLKTALRVLSNLAEMELENAQALRILGYRLLEIKEYELAVSVFEEVLKMREEEPQSYRDLGLAQAKNGNPQEAIENLYKVITDNWDNRFPEIELIALSEMNAIIATNNVNTDFMDEKLIQNLPVDVRIVLNWDTDNCDIDLWITDPIGEKCFYSHNKTKIGGIMTKDFTRGYGPEVFLLKKARKGNYKIQANYYGTSSQKLLGPVTLKLQFFTNYGTKQQKVKEVTLRLKEGKEVVNVADIEF